jgi:protein-tyrosine phosphatase
VWGCGQYQVLIGEQQESAMRPTSKLPPKFALVALALAISAPAAAKVSAPLVARSPEGALSIKWVSDGPVDVYVADRADATVKTSKLVSARDADGQHVYVGTANGRSYFLLREVRTGSIIRVAERLLPLDNGSNFRDVGGYAAAVGKHVRWGKIYRSGGTPVLSNNDLARIKALGLGQMVDLRSNEERVLAPSRIEGVAYTAVGYSMASLMPNMSAGNSVNSMEAAYRNFPTLLAPQLRILFKQLVAGGQPIAYNCSAGQDRTGFTTAMILSVLGVSRSDILTDYHLSTNYRRPENEMPKIDVAAHANNPVALYFAKAMQSPGTSKAMPLKTADGTAFLNFALDEVEKHWGSIDAYLAMEIGVSAADRKRMRQLYLE